MKGYPFGFLLLAASLLSAPAYAGDGCATNAQKRVVVGRKPTANTLYARIQGVDMGSWKDGFDTETFTYIGDVHAESDKIYKIGYLETSWGAACRSTNRLMIFDAKDDYLGQYAPLGMDAKHVRIQGSVLIFPFDPKDGNKLDLSNGPPAKAWLDGDNEEWSAAPAPKT